MATGALIIAGIGAAIGGASAQRQAETARRAETRAKGVAAAEQSRQREQEALIAAQEKTKSQQIGARLKATAGRRSGRRSLISGSETGLGQQQVLG